MSTRLPHKFAAVLILVLCSSQAQAQGWGTFSGKITYDGQAPAQPATTPETIGVSTVPSAHCAEALALIQSTPTAHPTHPPRIQSMESGYQRNRASAAQPSPGFSPQCRQAPPSGSACHTTSTCVPGAV